MVIIEPLRKDLQVTHLPIEISDINFIPTRPLNGHIGFVSFTINQMFKVSSVSVYTYLNPQPKKPLYRLVYPTVAKGGYPIFKPISKEFGDIVEKDVSCYIENLKG